MKQLVIMPGGFHPFHAGHAALYRSALETFPRADVYVAATADTSNRPFPFAIKQRLAQLAGVPANRFVQVKSPFQAKEITQKYDADDTQLIFVRSEKDRDQQPRPGGVKKGGEPSYLQPLGTEALPMSQRGYMAYLPTVEFGPRMTSATEIRRRWPDLSDDQKTSLVQDLYPALIGKRPASDKIVAVMDQILGQDVKEAVLINDPEQGLQIRPDGGMGTWDEQSMVSNLARKFAAMVDMVRNRNYAGLHHVLYKAGVVENMVRALAQLEAFQAKQGRRPIARGREIDMGENQGWAATYNEEMGQMAGTPASGMQASYQRRENQPMGEDFVPEKT